MKTQSIPPSRFSREWWREAGNDLLIVGIIGAGFGAFGVIFLAAAGVIPWR